jgi:hypothetical protein
LPDARHELGASSPLGPRYSDLASGSVGDGFGVAWDDPLRRARVGVIYVPAQGVFYEATAGDIAAIPPRNGLSTHAAYPPDPEPLTGVSVAVDIPGATATFSRAEKPLGTVRFPSLPGAYVAAFENTRTAFFWNNQEHAPQAALPLAEQRHSYLVGLESGAACRVERELAYPATAVFRRRTFVVFVNALRTKPAVHHCPPGAPCVAPEQPHFAGASLVVLRDRGP